mmetsp:Transcript_32648/g.84298  ORF Transcript_32648/g.84298 Transcript_32648/m.84298 type:complete len:171 (-) Transcript_32648:543-1055(-)
MDDPSSHRMLALERQVFKLKAALDSQTRVVEEVEIFLKTIVDEEERQKALLSADERRDSTEMERAVGSTVTGAQRPSRSLKDASSASGGARRLRDSESGARKTGTVEDKKRVGAEKSIRATKSPPGGNTLREKTVTPSSKESGSTISAQLARRWLERLRMARVLSNPADK